MTIPKGDFGARKVNASEANDEPLHLINQNTDETGIYVQTDHLYNSIYDHHDHDIGLLIRILLHHAKYQLSIKLKNGFQIDCFSDLES